MAGLRCDGEVVKDENLDTPSRSPVLERVQPSLFKSSVKVRAEAGLQGQVLVPHNDQYQSARTSAGAQLAPVILHLLISFPTTVCITRLVAGTGWTRARPRQPH